MREIEFMGPSERMIGITIPENNIFYVLNHDEVLRVNIDITLDFILTDDDPYEFKENNSSFIGVTSPCHKPNDPILSVGDRNVSFKFKPTEEFVRVRCEVSDEIEDIDFPILSGDWFCATLSIDGRYLVLAEPYELAVYDLENGYACLRQKNKFERNIMKRLFAFIRRIIIR